MSPPRLHEADIPKTILEVIERLRAQGHAAYLVGGCVRDLLRGAHPKDFDVASSAEPTEVQGAFRKVIPTGIQHGTVTVVTPGGHVEVTTFRSEGDYHDGRRPSSVTFERDIVKDLSRRDFTINAMAYDPTTRELVDPFGGQEDLAAKLIRCVGEASARFGEDGLRALRAVRFAAVLDFSLDPITEAAIRPALDVFRKVAIERVREEFTKLLTSARARLGLELLERTGLLEEFLPEVARLDPQPFELAATAASEAPADFDLRLSALLADAAVPDRVRVIGLRLKLPNKSLERVVLLAAHGNLKPWYGADDPTLRRLLARIGLEAVRSVLEVALARTRAQAPSEIPELERVSARLWELADSKPPLTTRDLALNGGQVMQVLAVGPSAAVGQATRYLLDCVLDDPAANSAERLSALLLAWKASSGL